MLDGNGILDLGGLNDEIKHSSFNKLFIVVLP